MRPRCCAQGHELVWLTDQLAVCNECDEEGFIYHHPGLLKQLVEYHRREPLTDRVPTGDWVLRPSQVVSVAGLLMLFQ